jgi:hypothetical protein
LNQFSAVVVTVCPALLVGEDQQKAVTLTDTKRPVARSRAGWLSAGKCLRLDGRKLLLRLGHDGRRRKKPERILCKINFAIKSAFATQCSEALSFLTITLLAIGSLPQLFHPGRFSTMPLVACKGI